MPGAEMIDRHAERDTSRCAEDGDAEISHETVAKTARCPTASEQLCSVQIAIASLLIAFSVVVRCTHATFCSMTS